MSALPVTMTCIEITKFGGPEVLVPATRPVPRPKAGEILIKVAATAVNRPDIAQRMGNYAPPPGASDLPGLEASGTVAELGEGVSGWSVGDEICALTPGGAYAEYCVVPAPQCLPLPKGFDLLHAAALPENYFTVWHNLFERGQLKAGETALIHGGASGIGTTAIQLAKSFGATVLTTVRTQEKANAVKALGADHAILYKDNDWAAEVKKLSGGVDVVLDMVAGDYLPKNLSLLKLDGRCVVIAVQGGATATISAGFLMVNRLTLTGSTLRPQSIESKGRMARGLKEKVWPLLEAGSIKPIIYKTFPLRDAAGAHAELERADHVGKVMMTV
ncbi:NAD(P)H-quinone oxidoreductase [Reyranella sp.]|uniref:NAD(P)H-quinone oxidoreductase n=1 Tax=Reyranella sp. TaxID=1929291 RepID=UPI00261AFBAD|nr:NAD(P)H-quinone oxidoreductase [Reyranella sp.]HQS14620.1 NAD(P)H-quinone oxidoreductase [Reyranella sp.]HQT12466.1 NAD(P)H-quinone oxidoreductase [Reyranella sp.]